MRESGYYPPGAEFDPNAPYNEVVPPELKFTVTISQTLSKDVEVYTSNYVEDEGIDTSETNWQEVYKERHLTPLDLINRFKEYLCGMTIPTHEVKFLIEECKSWVEDDLEICE